MSYSVTVEFAPAHELVMSLDAYMVASSHRSMDLGDGWVGETQRRLTPAFAAKLAGAEPLDYRIVGLLVHQCPGARDAEGFLHWLAHLSPGELYERLSPFIQAGDLRTDLGALRDEVVARLSQWNQEYFRHVDPALLEGLAADAARVSSLGAALPPELLVEEATRGYYLQAAPAIREVLLVPHYHKRPITLQGQAGGSWLFYYPAADFPGAAGEPPVDLLRLTRTLADESRLRLIHFLAGGTRTFMEIVAHMGLTKGTVHRHLWALRFAGLVRASLHDGRFTLRPGALGRVTAELTRFVQEQ